MSKPKIAIVTACMENHIDCLRVMDYSLSKHNNLEGIDKFVISRDIKEWFNWRVLKPSHSKYKDIEEKYKVTRFVPAFYKLDAFSLFDYDRVILMDADMLCINNLEEIFDTTKFNEKNIYFCKDDGVTLNNKFKDIDRVNSGFAIINKPLLNKPTYDSLINMSLDVDSYDGGDQGVINNWLVDNNINFGYLPMIYNTLKRIYQYHRAVYNNIKDNIKIIHYVGRKPFQDNKAELPEYNELLDLWESYNEERNYRNY